MASSSRSVESPRAIPILKRKKHGFEVDKHALETIFGRPDIQDKPVCIVSISGAFRKGKSFMLNFFIRYLRNKGNIDDCWMGDEDAPLNDGFDWRGGMDTCTNGVLIWNEIFTVERKTGEVAVILMDTQGLFDLQAGNKGSSVVFALSTLISSVQILNVMQMIQENDLEYLQFFTDYARAARGQASDTSHTPFQTLLFLVRDWPYDEDFPFGTDGGQGYLEQILKGDQSRSKEISGVRKYLRSSFDNTRCCLMPYPGQKVATAKNTSDLSRIRPKDIEKKFLEHSADFVASLFNPQNLVVKTINGKVVHASEILPYIYGCSASLVGGKLPDPRTMMENVAERQNFEAQRICKENYIASMSKINEYTFVDDDDDLRKMHTQAYDNAMDKFAKLTLFGAEENRNKHREYLKEAISREFKMLIERNENWKVKAHSHLLTLVQEIVSEFEINLEKVTAEKQSISDEKLARQYERLQTKADDDFSKETRFNPQIEREYRKKLQGRMERIYGGIKSENSEKRQISEEKDEEIQQMMILELQHLMQYRKEMRKLLTVYVDEEKLRHNSAEYRDNALDSFEMEVLKSKVKKDSKAFSERYASLENKLDKEYEETVTINSEKKATLSKSVESKCKQVLVDYDTTFSKILKGAHLKQDDLKEQHDIIVDALMLELRDAVRENSDLPFVAEQLRDTQRDLDVKYTTVVEWNEKNKTVFKMIASFLKSAVISPTDISQYIWKAKKMITPK